MIRLFNKSQIMTIPNLLSMFRILLLAPIVWLYSCKQDYATAIILLIVSGLTDIADGIIARKFNMISDFGKILDPIADKLTQFALLVCLAMRYKSIVYLVGVFVVKELLMIALGYITIKKKDSVNSAKWYGKLNTVVIYSTIVLLIMFPDIPQTVADMLAGACIGIIIISFLLYARFYRGILKN